MPAGGTTVFSGIATLDPSQYLAGLQQLREQTVAAAAEMKTALSGISLAVRTGAAQTRNEVAAAEQELKQTIVRGIDGRWQTINDTENARHNFAIQQQVARYNKQLDAEKTAAKERLDQVENERQQRIRSQTQAFADENNLANTHADDELSAQKQRTQRMRTSTAQSKQEDQALLKDWDNRLTQYTQQQDAEYKAQTKQSTEEARAYQARVRQQQVQDREQARAQARVDRETAARERQAAQQQARAQAQAARQQVTQQRNAARASQQAARNAARGGSGGRRPTAASAGGSNRANQYLGETGQKLKQVEDAFNSVYRAGAQMSQVGFMIGLASAAVGALGTGLVKGAQDFDAWITKAYAAARGVGEVGVSIDKFSQVAYRISQSVGAYDPTKVAESLYYWQSALGTTINTEKDLEKTEVALQAASMAGVMAKLDEAQAIRGVAQVLAEFNMDQVRALDVTAKLFNASQISNVEFGELLQSFKMVGPLAESLNIPMEQIVAVLEGLSDVGSRGTAAGRGVNQILTSFIKPSQQAADAMDNLFQKAFGKNHQDILFQMRDGVQQFIGLIDKLDEQGNVTAHGALYYLSEATKSLSEPDKEEFLTRLTSQNGMRALLPLLDEYERAQGKIANRYRELGDTQKQVDTFMAAWDIYSKTIEVGFGQQLNRIKETLIEVGRIIAGIILPYLKQLADGAQLFLAWANGHKELVGGIAALAAAFVVAGTALGGFLFLIGQWLQVTASISVLFRAFLPIIGILTGSLTGVAAGALVLVGAFILLSQAARTNFAGVQNAITTALSAGQIAIQALVQSVGWLVNMVSAFIRGDWAGAWDQALNIVSAIGVAVQAAISNIGPMILGALVGAVNGVFSFFENLFPSFRGYGKNLMESFAAGFLDAIADVVDAALSVIDAFVGFFESHSPPEKGPLKYVGQWGTALINEYMRGMKKADFKIVNDVVGAIEKELKARMESGAITPGEYFVKNMQAREITTHLASDLRAASNDGKALDPQEIIDRMHELTDLMGDGNEFVQAMFEAYANLAPLDDLIDKEKERLDVLNDQKRVLDDQLAVYKAQYDINTFDDNEEKRKLEGQLKIMRQEHRIEELGLPATTSAKKDAGRRAANRAVRQRNKISEHAIEQQIAVLDLGLLEDAEDYQDKTAPLRKESAEKGLEAAQMKADLNQKEQQAKPFRDKLDAAKEALAFQEAMTKLAETAAQEDEKRVNAAKKGAGGGGGAGAGGMKFGAPGDGGAALRGVKSEAEKRLEDAAEGINAHFMELVRKSTANALRPFTEFSDGVEKQRLALKDRLQSWGDTLEDFWVGLGALYNGTPFSQISTAPSTLGGNYDAAGNPTPMTGRPERVRSLPGWMTSLYANAGMSGKNPAEYLVGEGWRRLLQFPDALEAAYTRAEQIAKKFLFGPSGQTKGLNQGDRHDAEFSDVGLVGSLRAQIEKAWLSIDWAAVWAKAKSVRDDVFGAPGQPGLIDPYARGKHAADDRDQENVAGFTKWLNDQIKATDWKSVGKTLGTKLREALGSIFSGSSDGREGVQITDLLPFLKSATSIATFVKHFDWAQLVKAIADVVLEAFGGFTNADVWVPAFDKLVLGMWNAFKQALTTGWKGVQQLITDDLVAPIRLVLGLDNGAEGQTLAVMALQAMEGFRLGIIQKLEKSKQDFLDSVTKLFIQPIKDLLGIKSPSTVFYDIGKDVVQGLINGVNSMLDEVKSKATSLGQTIKDGIESGLAGLASTVQAAIDVAKQLTAGPAAAASSFAQNLENKFLGLVRGHRHGGGGVGDTGWYFLDKGEHVLSGKQVYDGLNALSNMSRAAYHAGQTAIGGSVRLDVNVTGNHEALGPDAKERIVEAAVDAIYGVIRKR